MQTLTPHKFSKKEQEQNQIYFDFIKDAIDNYEVKNFAITGAYGTGKSTIIQNFFRLYPTETEDYTHAIVSLSSFCDTSTSSAKEEVIDKPEDTKTETSSQNEDKEPQEPKKEETSSPKKENKEREENKTKESKVSSSTSSHKPSLAELEMSILQQLFYQIDEKKLRFSRFQRKTKISTSNKKFIFTVCMGSIISFFYVFFNKTFISTLEKTIPITFIESTNKQISNIILLSRTITAVAFIILLTVLGKTLKQLYPLSTKAYNDLKQELKMNNVSGLKPTFKYLVSKFIKKFSSFNTLELFKYVGLLLITNIILIKSNITTTDSLSVIVSFIPFLFLITGAYILFERLYYGIYKGHWKKLQFNLGKIQSEHQITGSIINDNLHDILVFFHNAELDVVVFEDIDRLDNAMEIFTKLRELNETINRSHEFQSIKKKVLFIYALKDDILPIPEARTKFFDLIIPIVPLVSSDNSYNLFSQELKEIAKRYPQKDFIAINECISDDFLYTVGPYISDIRSIRNIVTEFYIQWTLLVSKTWSKFYNHNLDWLNTKIITELSNKDSEQLLILMIFKNLLPKEYQLARENRGLLYHIFSQGKIDLLKQVNNKESNINKTNLSDILVKLNNKKRLDLAHIYLFKNNFKDLTANFLIVSLINNYLNENYNIFINQPIDGIFTLNDYIYCRIANSHSTNTIDLSEFKINNPSKVILQINPLMYNNKYLLNKELVTRVISSAFNSNEKEFLKYIQKEITEFEESITNLPQNQIELFPVYKAIKSIILDLNKDDRKDKYMMYKFLSNNNFNDTIQILRKDPTTIDITTEFDKKQQILF